jgi:cytochrome P450
MPAPLPFPFPRKDILRADPRYRELRRDRPVAEVVLSGGTPAYLVTRYDDVRRVLEDPCFSRIALSRAGPRDLVAYAPPRAVDPDTAHHSMPYELVNRWFTPRAGRDRRADSSGGPGSAADHRAADDRHR